MTAEDIRKHLESADGALADALAAGVGLAEVLAPPILEMVGKAVKGVYLIPTQQNLLFFGLHVLAAARHTVAYRPVLDLLRLPEHELEVVLGADFVEVSTSLLLGLFDSDADPLYAALAEPSVDGAAKWSLFQVIARLAWDGRVSRDRLIEFLDRFNRENLAPLDDVAWQGWQDAVLYLGLLSFEERVRRGWDAGRDSLWREPDRRDYLERLHHAAAHPDDPGVFIDDDVVEIVDVVAHLKAHRALPAVQQGAAAGSGMPDLTAPLSEDELDWLGGFLVSRAVPETAMCIEEVDGFFCALVAGPENVMPSEYLPVLWGTEEGNGPHYDSLEQAQYVFGLLMRHWNAIATDLGEGMCRPPVLLPGLPEERAQLWARGFLAGLDLRRDGWTALIGDEDGADLVVAIISLAAGDDTETIAVPKPKQRRKLVDTLPEIVLAIYRYWRMQASERPRPARSAKVGRNDPCPCGSGRKYKKCCGASSGSVH